MRVTVEHEVSQRRKAEISFFQYFPALSVALLKDFFGLVLFWLPGGDILLSLCFGPIIFILLFVFAGGTGGKKLAVKVLLRAGIVLAASVFDAIPFIGLLPLESLSIVLVYKLEKAFAKIDEKLGMEQGRTSDAVFSFVKRVS